ncbi:MAG: MarR family transcriptional regulator, partial [Intrasporangium sp.]|uniref:MarR family winged helix-turn-helix transcriptional regulator n=1 Tax=Intrasporangium sp. TaxID=1925024 RepID=UPI002648F866
LRPPFVEAGLGNGDFDVLAALRRSGDPFTLTPGQLSTSLLVTTGAISKRIDRLEARRLVRRTVSDADARSRLVTLTAAGVALTDELISKHLANEAGLLASLSTTERDQLATLLGRLAATMENRPDTEPVQTGEHR